MEAQTTFFRIAVLIAFVPIFLMGETVFAGDPYSGMNVEKPKVRVKAPAFTLKNLDGQDMSLSGFQGKVVILNFWATWCAPCREEMPAMEKLWNKYKDKSFVIIAISADRGSPEVVRRFIEEQGVSYPVLLDPTGKVRNQYEVVAFPTTYIIGRDGRITGRIVGAAPWGGPASYRLVEEALKGAPE